SAAHVLVDAAATRGYRRGALTPARFTGSSAMKCPGCQQENPPQAKFCLECATPLRLPPDGDGEALSVAQRLAESMRRRLQARRACGGSGRRESSKPRQARSYE